MQFQPLRKLKIQFEKSNNAGQFAGKCASHPNAVGIVHRLDTMRPIGGPGFLQHSRLFFARSTSPSLPLPQHLPCSSAYAVARGQRQTTFFVSFSDFFFFPLLPLHPSFFSFPFPPLAEFSRGQNRERNRSRCAICICGVEKWPLISSSCRPPFFLFFSTEPACRGGRIIRKKPRISRKSEHEARRRGQVALARGFSPRSNDTLRLLTFPRPRWFLQRRACGESNSRTNF